MACSSDRFDASSRKADAPAEAFNRNASSAAQPAKAARAFVAENVVGLEELEKAHLASRNVDAPACDASSRNADDASVR